MAQEVSSNGKTVWLNIEGVCRGRLCKYSSEYANERGEPLDFDAPPDWEGFISKCSQYFGVGKAQFEGHRPRWVGLTEGGKSGA